MSLKKPTNRRKVDSPAAARKPGSSAANGPPPPSEPRPDGAKAKAEAGAKRPPPGKGGSGSKASAKSTGKAEDTKSLSNERKRALLAAGAAATLTIFGVLLLVNYVKGNEATDAAAGAVESRQVLVVQEPIPSGTTLDELLSERSTSFQTEFVPLDHIAQGSLINQQQLEDLGDVMVEVDLAPGEQLLASRFVSRESFSTRAASVSVPDGHHQVSFALSPTRSLGGLVRAGDDISVIASFAAHEDLGNISAIILPSVEVINVQTDGEIAGSSGNPDAVNTAPTGNYLITVAVEPPELTKLSYAIDYGQIMIAAAPGVGAETAVSDTLAVTTMGNVLDVLVFDDVPEPNLLAFDDSGIEEPGEDDAAESGDNGSRTRYGEGDESELEPEPEPEPESGETGSAEAE